MTPEEEIFDGVVRHQIGLQRLSTANVRQIMAVLRRVDADVVARLANEDVANRARLERFLETIRAIVDSAYTDAFGQLQIDLRALMDYEIQYNADLIGKVLQVETVRPNPEMVWSATFSRPFQGKILREWFTELSTSAFARLRNVIRQGAIEGQTVSQMIQAIRGTKAQGYKDGIADISRRQAEATVRTAINHTATNAKENVYRANNRLIKGVMWVSVLDSRTSAVCRGRSGQIYPIDSGPRPPAHPNCRSTVTPVLKNSYAGLTDDMPGRVSSDMNYDDWLRRQPVAFQNDVLGKDKATLFRQGGLTLDRFIDRQGQEYTLDELKRREAEAWSRSGL